MSRKSVLISSLLHSIATNYNSEVSDIVGDKLTFTVIISIVIISIVYQLLHMILQKSILLSGDIKLNPGPETNRSTSVGIITRDRSNALFNYRLL